MKKLIKQINQQFEVIFFSFLLLICKHTWWGCTDWLAASPASRALIDRPALPEHRCGGVVKTYCYWTCIACRPAKQYWYGFETVILCRWIILYFLADFKLTNQSSIVFLSIFKWKRCKTVHWICSSIYQWKIHIFNWKSWKIVLILIFHLSPRNLYSTERVALLVLTFTHFSVRNQGVYFQLHAFDWQFPQQ